MHTIVRALLPVLLTVLLFGRTDAEAAGASKKVIAVLELANNAGLTVFEIETLADDVRSAALDVVGSQGEFRIMTRENMLEMLPPGTDLAQCENGQCEVEAGRKVGADRVVSGSVGNVGGQIVVRLKMFNTETADLLAQRSAEGADVRTVRASLKAEARSLFDVLARRGGQEAGLSDTGAIFAAPPSGAQGVGPSVSRGSVTEAFGDLTITAKPKDKARLDITDPAGKTTVSGAVYKNQHAMVGKWEVKASAPGFESVVQSFAVPPDEAKAVNLQLTPLGGLSISGPSGAEVKVTGPGGFSDKGGLPWQAQGLESGTYRVEVTRGGYIPYKSEERIRAGETVSVKADMAKVAIAGEQGTAVSVREAEAREAQAQQARKDEQGLAERAARDARRQRVSEKHPIDFQAGYSLRLRRDAGLGHGYGVGMIIQPQLFLDRQLAIELGFRDAFFADKANGRMAELLAGLRYQLWRGDAAVYLSALIGGAKVELSKLNSSDQTEYTNTWVFAYGAALGAKYYVDPGFFVDLNLNASNAGVFGLGLSLGTGDEQRPKATAEVDAKNTVDFTAGYLYVHHRNLGGNSIGGAHGYDLAFMIQPKLFWERRLALVIDYASYYFSNDGYAYEFNSGLRYQHWIGDFAIYTQALLGAGLLSLKDAGGNKLTSKWMFDYKTSLGAKYYMISDFFLEASANTSRCGDFGVMVALGTNAVYPAIVVAAAGAIALAALSKGSSSKN